MEEMEILRPVIGREEVRKAADILKKYKQGKAIIQTDGTVRISLANAVSAGSSFSAYITGFWFV